MKMIRIAEIKPIIFALLILAGCTTTSRIGTRNMAFLYAGGEMPVPALLVFHENDSMSTLFVELNCRAMMLKEEDNENELVLSYKLLESIQKEMILDSASFSIDRSAVTEKGYCRLNIPFRAQYGHLYLLEVNIMTGDGTNPLTVLKEVDKTSRLVRQNFLLRDQDLIPLMDHHVLAGDIFGIDLNTNELQRLFVGHYHREYPIALPPFSYEKELVFDYAADSLFTINLFDGFTGMLSFTRPGFYHMLIDSSQRTGFTLFVHDDGFPEVANPENMLLPLRYLTTSKEFNQLSNSSNLKVAIDSFWLVNAGSIGRARNLIQRYYSRVEAANRMFSSYQEGWKTDRGMVYIIYGPPDVVYFGEDTEKWIYGEPRNPRSVKFNFTRIENPFSNEDYNLIRSPVFKESWYNTVENWRR